MDIKNFVTGRNRSAAMVVYSAVFANVAGIVAVQADPVYDTSMMRGANRTLVTNPINLGMGSGSSIGFPYLPSVQSATMPNPSELFNFDGTLKSGDKIYDVNGQETRLTYAPEDGSEFYRLNRPLYSNPEKTSSYAPFFESAVFCFSKNRDPHRNRDAYIEMGSYNLLDCDVVVQAPIHHVLSIPDPQNNCELSRVGTGFYVTGLPNEVESLYNNMCYDIGLLYGDNRILWSGRSACSNFSYRDTMESCGEPYFSVNDVSVDIVQDSNNDNVYYCQATPVDHVDSYTWTIEYQGQFPTTYLKEGSRIDVTNLGTYTESLSYSVSCAANRFLSDTEYRSETLVFQDDVVENMDGVSEILDGGVGNDILMYQGNYADYTITVEGDGKVYISRQFGSVTEQDVVSNFERIEFADGYLLNGVFKPNDAANYILLMDGSVSPYASAIQGVGDMSYVVADNKEILITANTWLKHTYVDDVKPGSILRFDYLGAPGELNGIGIDTNDTYRDNPKIYMIDGTQRAATTEFDTTHTYTGNETWQRFEIPLSYSGEVQYIVFVNDNDEASSNGYGMFRNIAIIPPSETVEDTGSSPYMNFSSMDVTTYAPAQQDGGGTYSVLDGGRKFVAQGNNWFKAQMPEPYNVTSHTILQMDFCPEVGGEIQGAGVDNDNNYRTTAIPYDFYGSEVPHSQFLHAPYSGNGQCERLRIPVGAQITGPMNYVTFINDEDVAVPQAKAAFDRVVLFENGDAPYLDLGSMAGQISSYSNDGSTVDLRQDNGGATLTVIGDGRSMVVDGNGWKKIKLPEPYIVQPNSVLEYQVYIEGTGGEIQGLFVENDDSYLNGPVFPAFYVGQTLNQYFNDTQKQNITGRWVTVEVPVGEIFEPGYVVEYLTVVNDDDKTGATPKAQYRDVILYKKDDIASPTAALEQNNDRVSDVLVAGISGDEILNSQIIPRRFIMN